VKAADIKPECFARSFSILLLPPWCEPPLLRSDFKTAQQRFRTAVARAAGRPDSLAATGPRRRGAQRILRGSTRTDPRRVLVHSSGLPGSRLCQLRHPASGWEGLPALADDAAIVIGTC
jgi:hypothetical protein